MAPPAPHDLSRAVAVLTVLVGAVTVSAVRAAGSGEISSAAPPPADRLAPPGRAAAVSQDSLALEPVPLQEDSRGLLSAPVLEVRGRRLTAQEILDRQPGFATVLDASSWSGGVASAATVLSAAVGVNVRETGGIGSYSSMSIRGSTPGQVPVFLDGIPLDTPDRLGVNLADIDLTSLERIEVYRGAAPLVLGGGSLGGAVHLYSARSDPHPWIRLTAGSYETRILEGGGRKDAGAWSLLARGRYVASEGGWEFLDDKGTLYDRTDDTQTTRINNDTAGGGLLLTGSRKAGPWQLRVSELLDAREQGTPGLSLVQSDRARSSSLTHQLRVDIQAPGDTPGYLRSVEVFHRFDRQTFFDPDGDLRLGRTDRRDGVHSVGAAASGAIAADDAPAWRIEARWARLRSHDRLQADGEGEPQTRLTAAAAVQPVARLAAGRLRIAPGLRIEVHHDRLHGTPPFSLLPQGAATTSTTWAQTLQLGTSWRVGPGLQIKANLGRAMRVPTLLERFGVRGTIVGNPDLTPETGVNRDVGLIWHDPAGARRLGLTLFDNDQWDLITFRPTSPASARAFNVGRASARGVEAEIDFGWAGPLRNRLDVTALSAIDRTDDRVAGGTPLPGRPAYQIEYRWDVRVRSVQLGYQLSALGRSYAETGARTPIPGRVLHALQGRWSFGQVRLDLRLENVTDQQIFDLWGYPLPGRTAVVSFSTGAP